MSDTDYVPDPNGGPAPAQGRVCAVHRGRYQLLCEYGELPAQLKTGGYYRDDEMQFPTVGDDVRFEHNPSGVSRIVATLPRRSLFCRSDFLGHNVRQAGAVLRQPVAANFDTVFVVMALNHDFNLRRCERYIAQCRQSGGTPVVVLNKADLADDPAAGAARVAAVAPGVQVHAVSAATGQGMQALLPYTAEGQTVVLLGSSGVGKSSIVNALLGEERMRVNGIREDDSRGRHTTTHRQMLALPGGGMLIDTPGMRELGLYDAGEGVDETFSDITRLAAQCKFANCGHQSEPGCAVRRALEDGTLDEDRWGSYQQLERESRFVQRRAQAMQRIEATRTTKHSFQAAKARRKEWMYE